MENVLFDEKEGKIMLAAAREAITNFLKNRISSPPAALVKEPKFQQKRGCFVTLRTKGSGELRGCIGFAEPAFKLSDALTHAAIASATEDPRFVPVSLEEFKQELAIEVSVLTPPFAIDAKKKIDLPKMIYVGKDGLILKWTYGAGLLLPQVATEYDWTAEEFLENLSIKAGAPPDEWLAPDSIVYKFQAQIFTE